MSYIFSFVVSFAKESSVFSFVVSWRPFCYIWCFLQMLCLTCFYICCFIVYSCIFHQTCYLTNSFRRKIYYK
jgi:hypothetical protein